MTSKTAALLFYARDFLSDEFPKLAKTADQDHAHIYVISKHAETARIKAADPEGHIFNVADYIAKAHAASIVRDDVFHTLHQGVYRDRFMARMDPDDIAPIVHGVRQMLDDIGAQFHVRLYLDEPVSGFINASLNRWVTAQGGQPCHFHTTWVPGHVFFVKDPAQNQPIALNAMSGGKARLMDHIGKRLKDAAKPSYLHNYNSTLRVLKEAARFGAMGLYRRMRKAEIFIDQDPWPHDFQSASLRASLTGRYTSMQSIRALKNARFVVFPMHYEPEAVISYYSDFVNQLNLVTQIFQSLPADTYLLLKEHPSQPGAAQLSKWKELRQNKRVKVIKGTEKMSDLLELDTITCSIGSTAVLETVMKGRPAYVFGDPHFKNMPGVTHVQDIQTLQFDWTPPPVPHDTIAQWYGSFMDTHAIPGQFMRGRTFIQDPKGLIQGLLKAAS